MSRRLTCSFDVEVKAGDAWLSGGASGSFAFDTGEDVVEGLIAAAAQQLREELLDEELGEIELEAKAGDDALSVNAAVLIAFDAGEAVVDALVAAFAERLRHVLLVEILGDGSSSMKSALGLRLD